MKEENIVKLIKKEPQDLNLQPVVLIYGYEDLLKKQLIEKFKNRASDFHFLWGDETNLNQLKTIFSSGSLFSKGNIAVVWDVDSFLSNLKKEHYKDFIEFLKKVEHPDMLFLVSSKEKLPTKSPYKEITSTVQLINSPKLTPKAFEISVYKKIEKAGKKIDIDTLKYLVSKLPRNLYDTKQEIEKLLIYAADKDEITKEDIDEIVLSKPEANIFAFQSQFLKKDITALKTLKILVESGQHPFEIQSFILNTLNKLLLYKSLQSKGVSKSESFLKAGINYRPQQQLIEDASKIWTLSSIIKAINLLYETEVHQKMYYAEIEKKLEEYVMKVILS